MHNEEWRPTHHPSYDVSNLGHVRSRARGGLRTLKPSPDKNGYPTVQFGRSKRFYIHRLVAAAFIGPCPEGQEVRHKDDSPNNPKADNLEYGTRSQNVQDSVNRGRFNRPRKISWFQHEDIRTSKDRGVDLAKRYGISVQHVCGIRKGRK